MTEMAPAPLALEPELPTAVLVEPTVEPVEAVPVKPAAVAAKPVAVPVKPVAVPVKPATVPAKPVAVSAKSAPVKPAAVPVKPAAVPVKPVAVPVAVPVKPAAVAARSASMKLLPESRLWMDGGSTLHDWTCKSTQLIGSFTATMAPGQAPQVTQATITVPVDQVDCKDGNETMNKLMRKALGSDRNPNVRYELTGATVRPGGTADVFELLTKGTLTISGKSRAVEMTVQGHALAGGKVRFTGSHPLKMSDYGVKRPSALLGTIKAKDEVTVRFDVVVGP